MHTRMNKMYESKPENRVIDDLQPGLVSLPALYLAYLSRARAAAATTSVTLSLDAR